MNNNWVTKKWLGVTLSATIGLSALGAVGVPASNTAYAAVSYDTTITYGVNLRDKPGLSGDIIRMLKKGEKVAVVTEAGSGWLQVETAKGEKGFISSADKYSSYQDGGQSGGGEGSGEAENSSKRSQVISLAKSYMGRVTYDFGTRNPSKLIFDCSSFTQFIYEKVGVDLKWGTSSQKSQGKAVSRSNLNTGDLIFFDTIGSNNGVINHVGIYMGNGQFIHNAPSADGVLISPLDSGYWKDRYVSARNVL